LCAAAGCSSSGSSRAVDGAAGAGGRDGGAGTDAAGGSGGAAGSSAAGSGGAAGGADAAGAGTCGMGVPAGQACTTLTASGPGVMPTCATGAVPAGQGGTIVDGTYVLTAVTHYYNTASCSTEAISETVRFTGTCIEVATSVPFTTSLAGTFTVSGNVFQGMRACTHVEADGATVTVMDNATRTYTATPTTFTLYEQTSDGGSVGQDQVAVFTKQ
jgi:hypothetical protein